MIARIRRHRMPAILSLGLLLVLASPLLGDENSVTLRRLREWYHDYKRSGPPANIFDLQLRASEAHQLFEKAAATNDPDVARLLLEAAAYEPDWSKLKGTPNFLASLIRSSARRALLSMSSPEIRRRLTAIARQSASHYRTRRQLIAVAALAKTRDESEQMATLFTFVHLLHSPKSHPEVRLACLHALVAIDRVECMPLLFVTLSDRDIRVRVTGIRCIGQLLLRYRDSQEATYYLECAVERLLRTIETDPNFPVVIAALGTVVHWPRIETIDRLVEFVSRRFVGKGSAEIRKLEIAGSGALEKLTGKYMASRDPKDWQEWWAAERSRFHLPKRSASTPYRTYAKAGRFYGVPIVGRRVVFVIDVSGSMAGKKLEKTKAELERALTRLAPTSRFNIIFFHSRVESWKKRLIRCSPVWVRTAKKYVRSRTAGGATDLFGGLARAFGVEHAGGRRAPRAVLPDQIVILSDGDPTTGELIDPFDILREMRRVNGDGAVRIDVVSIGWNSPFLRQLAKENGGDFSLFTMR